MVSVRNSTTQVYVGRNLERPRSRGTVRIDSSRTLGSPTSTTLKDPQTVLIADPHPRDGLEAYAESRASANFRLGYNGLLGTRRAFILNVGRETWERDVKLRRKLNSRSFNDSLIGAQGIGLGWVNLRRIYSPAVSRMSMNIRPNRLALA